ncbi:hypothetical protein SNEBB_010484, partial [Seison nebaliae]
LKEVSSCKSSDDGSMRNITSVLLNEGYSVSSLGELQINVNFDYYLIYHSLKSTIKGKTIWDEDLFVWKVPEDNVLTSITINGKQRIVYLLLSNGKTSEIFLANRNGISKTKHRWNNVLVISYIWKDDLIYLQGKHTSYHCSIILTNCIQVQIPNEAKQMDLTSIKHWRNPPKKSILVLANRPKISAKCKEQSDMYCKFQAERNISLSKGTGQHLSFTCDDVVKWMDPLKCNITLQVDFTQIKQWYSMEYFNTINLIIFIGIIILLTIIAAVILWRGTLWFAKRRKNQRGEIHFSMTPHLHDNFPTHVHTNYDHKSGITFWG